MLAAITIGLSPLKPTRIETDTGWAVHRLFFSLLEQRNSVLTETVRNFPRLKPFTVSSIRGRFSRVGDYTLALPTETYHIRFTTLTEPVYNALSEALLVHQLYEMPMSCYGEEWTVRSVSIGQYGDRDTKLSDYATLWRRAAMQPRVTFRWLSPTVFKRSSTYLLFPFPWHVFYGLINKWQAFSPVPLPDGLLDFIKTHIIIEAPQLRTRLVHFDSFQIRGFVGWCRFQAMAGGPDEWRALQALADFAYFAGTGYKTTMGLGQTRTWRNNHGKS